MLLCSNIFTEAQGCICVLLSLSHLIDISNYPTVNGLHKFFVANACSHCIA